MIEKAIPCGWPFYCGCVSGGTWERLGPTQVFVANDDMMMATVENLFLKINPYKSAKFTVGI